MIALLLSTALAHSPQAASLEVVLDDEVAGVVRWRVPMTGPSAGLVVSPPSGCASAPPDVRRVDGSIETAIAFRCAAPPERVGLTGLGADGQLVATIRRPGGERQTLLGGDDDHVGLEVAPVPLPSSARPSRAAIAGLALLGALGLHRLERLRPLAHVVGTLACWAILRRLLFGGW
jgi:hypothetical protein